MRLENKAVRKTVFCFFGINDCGERYMAIRAAVASSDGKIVNRHFGKADCFLIFELRDGEFRYIEKRNTVPCCNMWTHEESSFENTAKALSDCSVIIAGHIGRDAADFMENRGFAVYEAPFPISAVLDKLVKESGDEWQ